MLQRHRSSGEPVTGDSWPPRVSRLSSIDRDVAPCTVQQVVRNLTGHQALGISTMYVQASHHINHL